MTYEDRLKKCDYHVADANRSEALNLVKYAHYAKGASRTGVYVHGLYHNNADCLLGVAWWLPPTGPAARSVHPDWTKVLSLSRMAIFPGMPKNACSFLLGRSMRMIRHDGRFHTLLTYADQGEGHDGWVYRACGFIYLGPTAPSPVWVDTDGKRVSPKATVTRTKAQMEALGHRFVGKTVKHKYVKYLEGAFRAEN